MAIRSAIDFNSPFTDVRVVDMPGIHAASFRAFLGYGHWMIGTIPGYVPNEGFGYVDSVQIVKGDEDIAMDMQDIVHKRLEQDMTI
jgi:hypothetical protein